MSSVSVLHSPSLSLSLSFALSRVLSISAPYSPSHSLSPFCVFSPESVSIYFQPPPSSSHRSTVVRYSSPKSVYLYPSQSLILSRSLRPAALIRRIKDSFTLLPFFLLGRVGERGSGHSQCSRACVCVCLCIIVLYFRRWKIRPRYFRVTRGRRTRVAARRRCLCARSTKRPKIEVAGRNFRSTLLGGWGRRRDQESDRVGRNYTADVQTAKRNERR